MRHHNRRGLSRDGQGPRPTRTRSIPPKTTNVALARTPRNHALQNARLVARGDVGLFIDLSSVGDRQRGKGAGTGRPYPEAVIRALVVVSTIFNLPLRQTEGFGNFLVGQLDLVCKTPDHSTLCRRRKDLAWSPPRLRSGQVIVIDATPVRRLVEM